MKPLPMCLVWECPDCRTANTAGMPRCAKCGRLKPVFGIKIPDPPEDARMPPLSPKTPKECGFRGDLAGNGRWQFAKLQLIKPEKDRQLEQKGKEAQ